MSHHSIQLLVALTRKEIKSRYKNAVLGVLWIFINPLVQMLVMGIVFGFISKYTVKDYYLFLFMGLLPWNFFVLALTKSIPRLVYDRELVQKSKFPRAVIPLSVILSHLFHFLISWFLLMLFLAITGRWEHLYPEVLLLQWLGIILLVLFVSGLSLIGSALNIFFRDVNFIVQAGVSLWFYATPIIYIYQLIPMKFRYVYDLNPLILPFSLIQNSVNEFSLPINIQLYQLSVIAVTLITGIVLFSKKESSFSDWL